MVLKRKAVFLDRDGTINKAVIKNSKPLPPSSIEDLELLPGVLEAIPILKKLGYIPVVITNQPDVARGNAKLSTVEVMNQSICKKLRIDHIYMCLHDDGDNCECRKPKPGLILKASLDLDIDLTTSIFVGDRWRDIQAGQAVGCTCYFIDNHYDEPKPNKPFIVVTSLLEVATRIKEQP